MIYFIKFSGLDQHALLFNQEIRYKTKKELERNGFRWIWDQSNQVSNLGDKSIIIKRKEKPSDFPCYQNSELVIGIINRLDKNKFHQLMENYLSDERRLLMVLPDSSETLWTEIKNYQVQRFTTSSTRYSESVYLTRSTSHGRGTGRNRNSQSNRYQSYQPPQSPPAYYNPTPASASTSAHHSPAPSTPIKGPEPRQQSITSKDSSPSDR